MVNETGTYKRHRRKRKKDIKKRKKERRAERAMESYLEELFKPTAIFKASQLPTQIQNSLITKIYPKRYTNKTYSISDIKQTNLDAYHMTQTKRDKEWSITNLKIIKKLKLIGILSYGNGDYAWYSLINKKVYDMNHDLGEFSGFTSKENKKNMRSPMLYTQWEKDILSGKYIDAWCKK